MNGVSVHMNMQKYLWYVVESFRYIFKKVIAGSYDGYIFSFCEKVPEWPYLFVLPCTVNKGSPSLHPYQHLLSSVLMLVCAEFIASVVQSDAISIASLIHKCKTHHSMKSLEILRITEAL